MRVLVAGMAVALLAAVLVAPRARAVTGSNPTVDENAKSGNVGWLIPQGGKAVSDDASNQIKGYASATSVNKGEALGFQVTVKPAQSFTLDVYRVGYYGGLGARLMKSFGTLPGVTQPGCSYDSSTGRVECNWARSATLDVPSDWVSGLYFAVLT